ncbi:MAG: hypothetical protein PVI54_20965 [Desulfobacteraceae bacterium]|jgi:hypothetical protein
MTVGGLPEPFLDGDTRQSRRWRRERFDRILREDVRDIEPIRNIQLLGLFLDILRHRVGDGPLTIGDIPKDETVKPAGMTRHYLPNLLIGRTIIGVEGPEQDSAVDADTGRSLQVLIQTR